MIRPPTAEEFSTLIDELGLDIAPEEGSDYEQILGVLIGSMNAAAGFAVERDDPGVSARDAGRRPEPDEDPFNAIARWCRVKEPVSEGPLTGYRVGVKDCIAVAGVPMTFGSPLLEDYVPRHDSAIVERILAAGGEIVAITNMDDLAAGPSGETCRYGRICNPVDPMRITGGSSGGSATALYYDGVDVTVGTDTGGSIRDPASFCGVLGLKPTFGLVPMAGVGGLDETIDHAGPLARRTSDLAALLSAIAGPHPDEPLHRGLQRDDYLAAVAAATDDLEGFRIGVLAEGFGADVGAQAATVEAVREVIERMQELRAELVEVSVPQHLLACDLLYAIYAEGASALWRSGETAYGSARRPDPDFAHAFGQGFAARRGLVSTDVKATILAGEWLRRLAPGAVYAHAQRARRAIRHAYDRALQQADLLLLPTTPFVAYEATAVSELERVTRSWAAEANTAPFDLTGHPALSLPLAEVEGLPQGVMVVAPHFQEARMLSFAQTCERALGLRPSPPSL